MKRIHTLNTHSDHTLKSNSKLTPKEYMTLFSEYVLLFSSIIYLFVHTLQANLERSDTGKFSRVLSYTCALELVP